MQHVAIDANHLRVAMGHDDETPTLTDALGDVGRRVLPKDRHTLTVLNGDSSGKQMRIDQEDVFAGRGGGVALHFSDPALSRRHARFFRVGCETHVGDMHSTNGTFVNGQRVLGSVGLVDGDHVRLGAHRLLRYTLCDATEEQAAHELYESSIRDSASGAYNRSYFDRRFGAERAFAIRHGKWLSLLLLDIDDFKRINDTHGHVAGDGALRVVAACAQRMLRPKDVLARYGGDEFMVLCRDTTLNNALILSERIRASIQRLVLTASGNEFRVSVSIGVASANDERHCGCLIDAADSAMFCAKERGRNSVSGNTQ
jgi:two-component system cell cycle response regulator